MGEEKWLPWQWVLDTFRLQLSLVSARRPWHQSQILEEHAPIIPSSWLWRGGVKLMLRIIPRKKDSHDVCQVGRMECAFSCFHLEGKSWKCQQNFYQVWTAATYVNLQHTSYNNSYSSSVSLLGVCFYSSFAWYFHITVSALRSDPSWEQSKWFPQGQFLAQYLCCFRIGIYSSKLNILAFDFGSEFRHSTHCSVNVLNYSHNIRFWFHGNVHRL